MVSFFTLATGLSWLVWLPYILSRQGLGVWGFDFPQLLGTTQFLGVLPGAYVGPITAAFVVTTIMGGRTAVRQWGSRLWRWRVNWRWYAVALVGVPAADMQASGEILGDKQRNWLIDGLKTSTATWKVNANDLPLGLVVPDGKTAQEAVSNGDSGMPLGRETDIAQMPTAIAIGNVTGTVWLTADVHYAAAHHYSPERAAYKEFKEFWEFVSGPLNAGAFGPNKLDPTFGPEAVFVHAPPAQNSSPLDAYQHFGEVLIDGDSRDITVNLCDATGAILFSQVLKSA